MIGSLKDKSMSCNTISGIARCNILEFVYYLLLNDIAGFSKPSISKYNCVNGDWLLIVFRIVSCLMSLRVFELLHSNYLIGEVDSPYLYKVDILGWF